jgi:hypothetical protein
MAHDIFISYSFDDQKVVEGLSAYLEQNGIRCFVAYRDIPRGKSWAEYIPPAIENCKMMVYVHSSTANASDMITNEIVLCLKYKHPVLPFRIQNIDYSGEKAFHLIRINWIDAFPNPNECFLELLTSIKNLSPELELETKQRKEKREKLEQEWLTRKKKDEQSRLKGEQQNHLEQEEKEHIKKIKFEKKLKEKKQSAESYSIFISYRRDGSFETANLIADRLKHAGYSVFFDVEALKSGKFNEQLYRVIEQCTDFILVLPEKGLDRCHDESDWVRLETLHALEHKKNIIPVMLREFEFPKAMPQGMEELLHYQAVAANDFSYFDASIEKLKSYLHSKPERNWSRYKKYIWTAFISLIIMIAGIGSYGFYQSKLLARTCEKEILLMGGEFAKMNIALKDAEDVKKEWDKFLKDFALATPGDTSFIRKQFLGYVKHKLGNLQSPTPGLALSDASSSMLSKRGIKSEEIVVFYKTAVPSFYEDVRDYMTFLTGCSKMPYISETIARNAQLHYETIELSLKGDYLGYLSLLTTMPKAVYSDDFYKIRSELGPLGEIPVNKTQKEYESDQEVIMRTMENMVVEMGGNVKDDGLSVEKLQYELDQKKRAIGDAALSDATLRVNEKKMALDEKRAELAKKQVDLDEAYKRVLAKCAFTADEDQWMMWGKILKLATVARNTVNIRSEEKDQMEINRKEAIRKGIDPATLTEPANLVSLDEIFSEIYKRIDLFIQYNKDKDPNVTIYGTAAKQYFRLVRKGEIDNRGILMVGTENNVPHPVLKTGDIVIERKGKPISSVDEYAKLKDDPAPNVVKIVRFLTNGKKAINTVTIPDSKVLVGFVNLKESE